VRDAANETAAGDRVPYRDETPRQQKVTLDEHDAIERDFWP